MTKTLPLAELRDLATRALVACNTSEHNAALVSDALVAADAEGLAGHGVSRVPFYADQARSGKVDGHATPHVTTPTKAMVRVDARDGFAFPAIRAGLEHALELIDATGVVAVGVTNSHHAGAGGYHVEHAAAKGYLALGFTNSPSAMAPWGGHRGTFGTNPIAFACPRKGKKPPLVVDLSLSKVARGKIMVAEKQGEPIPEGWALDAEGKPTTDPKAAMAGTMVAIGDAKGSALALMVEILAAGLTGANFAYEASSFFTAEGDPPRIGQFFILIDPTPLAGHEFPARIEALLAEILAQPGTRLPGERRIALRDRARREGVTIPAALYEDLAARAAQ